jgi:hypothetical protein
MKELFAIAAVTLLALTLSAPTRAEDQGVPAASNVPGAQTPSIRTGALLSPSKRRMLPACRLQAVTDWAWAPSR